MEYAYWLALCIIRYVFRLGDGLGALPNIIHYEEIYITTLGVIAKSVDCIMDSNNERNKTS
jgi:hypothetical protein